MGYASSVVKARAAIRKKGSTTSLRRQVPGTYNEVTGAFTGATTTTQSVYVVSFPKVRLIEDKVRYFAKLYIATPEGAAIAPQTGDELLLGGRWLKLPTVAPLNPDDTTVIMYEVEVET